MILIEKKLPFCCLVVSSSSYNLVDRATSWSDNCVMTVVVEVSQLVTFLAEVLGYTI